MIYSHSLSERLQKDLEKIFVIIVGWRDYRYVVLRYSSPVKGEEDELRSILSFSLEYPDFNFWIENGALSICRREEYMKVKIFFRRLVLMLKTVEKSLALRMSWR